MLVRATLLAERWAVPLRHREEGAGPRGPGAKAGKGSEQASKGGPRQGSSSSVHPNQEAWGGRGKPWGVDAQPSPAGKGVKRAKKGRVGGGTKNSIEVEDTTFKSCGRRPSGGRPSLPLGAHPPHRGKGEPSLPAQRTCGSSGPARASFDPSPGGTSGGGHSSGPQQGSAGGWTTVGQGRKGKGRKGGPPHGGKGSQASGKGKGGGTHWDPHRPTTPQPHHPHSNFTRPSNQARLMRKDLAAEECAPNFIPNFVHASAGRKGTPPQPHPQAPPQSPPPPSHPRREGGPPPPKGQGGKGGEGVGKGGKGAGKGGKGARTGGKGKREGKGGQGRGEKGGKGNYWDALS